MLIIIMKKYTFLFLLCCICLTVHAQESIDQRIAEAVNQEDWPLLRTLYLKEGNALENDFLHPLSKFFLAHMYCRPDSAVTYGKELLTTYQNEVQDAMGGIIYYLANDLAATHQYNAAASILKQYCDALEKAGFQRNATFRNNETLFGKLAQTDGFVVEKPNKEIEIPLIFHSGDRTNPSMLFVEGSLNGHSLRITYDTGAGVNLLSPRMAKEVNATVISDSELPVSGVSTVNTQLAIVDSLQIGEVLYRNVPFYITDFSTGDTIADAKIKDLGMTCVCGSELMISLGEITFDFARNHLIIPATPSSKPDYAPNMYRSSSNCLLVLSYDKYTDSMIPLNFDTGASSNHLYNIYLQNHPNLFSSLSPTDTLRYAGIGGVHISNAYTIDWDYQIGHNTGVCPSVSVTDAGEEKQYQGNLGLTFMTRFDRITLNFIDMWVELRDPETNSNNSK